MTTGAVRAAVRIENEVIYGYGVVGAHLRDIDRQLAARRLAVHQQRRDDLRAFGTDLPAPAAAYEIPVPVIDAASARDLAVRLEDAAAQAAWALVASTAADSRARRLAVDMLGDAGTAAAHWRRRSGRSDDPALPGQPATESTPSQPSTTPTTSPSSSTAASGSTS
jgi:hypothetical protein